MALDTYSGLKSTIEVWAMRQDDPDFVPFIPTMVQLCESRLNRKLRLREQETTALLTIIDGDGTLPADFLELRELNSTSSGYRILENASPGFGGVRYANSGAGTSNFYSISGNVLTSYPGSPGALSLTYYAKIPALTDAAPTNWLLTKAPELYLYGSLLEGAPVMQDDARIQTWATLFEKALNDLIAQDTRSKYSKAAIRVRGLTP